jgi:two-component system OmpR family sensor kinase
VRIEQALGNLVDNAFQHGAGAVTLSARKGGGGKVELHVTDEGPGFPPGFAAQAFDRFTRADESRSERGTGLGLSIVDLIARAHGGSAHIRGSDVWVEL